jgi:hypothetical protein
MHKNKPNKHQPLLPKKRNPVVAALLKNPKRNAGAHKPESAAEPNNVRYNRQGVSHVLM